jgi:methylenetetrahydrofolate reductase (NADPH)
MALRNVFADHEHTLSLEFFPAKTATGQVNLQKVQTELAQLGPDFMTVTYGAGGGNQEGTYEAVAYIAQKLHLPVVSHLTCVGATKARISTLLDRYADIGVTDILALRGDLPKDASTDQVSDFAYASSLVDFLADDGRFDTLVAAFPEGHPECADRQQNWDHLAGKLSQPGVVGAITQMFFSVEDYLAMRSYLQAHHPGFVDRIIPGLMPVARWEHLVSFIERFSPTTQIPPELAQVMKPLQDDAIASRAAGLQYTASLGMRLLAAGAPGLHLYTLNKINPAAELIAIFRQNGYFAL